MVANQADPYGHQAGARPRPVLNNNNNAAAGIKADNEDTPKVKDMVGQGRGSGAKRAGPGFKGAFKAPPATDLIDQLLLEQD